MPADMKLIILSNNVNVKSCSWTRKFRKVVRQQILGEVTASPADYFWI